MSLGKTIGFKRKIADILLWTGIITSLIALIIKFSTALISYQPILNTTQNPHDLWISHSAWAGIWTAISTFTIQSNILVFLFFCFVLTNRFYENHCTFVHGRFALAVTTYITITAIVFFTLLFKPIIDDLDTTNSIKMINFINTFLLHLIVPIIMILYFIITAGKSYWGYKKQAYLWMPFISIYMFVYLGFVLIKGNFVGVFIKDKNIIDYSFPYHFLNFHQSLSTFLLSVGAILLLYIVIIALFTCYNNIRYNKINKSHFLPKT